MCRTSVSAALISWYGDVAGSSWPRCIPATAPPSFDLPVRQNRIDMARKEESLLDDLSRLPWWVSVVLAAVVFAALRWVAPRLFAADESGSLLSQLIGPLATMAPSLAPFAAVLLLPGAVSAFRQWKEGKLLDSEGSGSPALQLMDWKQFKRLVGEYYRRKGYRVRPTPDGPDGGVDLRLYNELGLHLVQCKHWQRDVGVRVVRELYGVMAAEGAYGGVVVTTGSFRADAKAFADGKRIDLVDGPDLRAMITEAQRPMSAQATEMDREGALEVLGLDTTASREEIDVAFKRLMQRVHPDKAGSGHFAKLLNEARDVLLADR